MFAAPQNIRNFFKRLVGV